MTLRNGDYEIHGDSITIRKEVLERWRDHWHDGSKVTVRISKKTN